jgi:hypothetical protein
MPPSIPICGALMCPPPQQPAFGIPGQKVWTAARGRSARAHSRCNRHESRSHPTWPCDGRGKQSAGALCATSVRDNLVRLRRFLVNSYPSCPGRSELVGCQFSRRTARPWKYASDCLEFGRHSSHRLVREWSEPGSLSQPDEFSSAARIATPFRFTGWRRLSHRHCRTTAACA